MAGLETKGGKITRIPQITVGVCDLLIEGLDLSVEEAERFRHKAGVSTRVDWQAVAEVALKAHKEMFTIIQEQLGGRRGRL